MNCGKRLSLWICVFLISTASVGAEPDVSMARLFDQQADSIVLIAARKGISKGRLGTGFILTSDGLIVTNAHVIKRSRKMVVKLRNNVVYDDVDVVYKDKKKDIALIKIAGKGLRPVKLGDSDNVEIGQRVVTIGNPLGLEGTIADGLISSRRSGDHGMDLLQISVPLSPGSSGGPLFNLQGEVIGITTATLATGQNLNFAVPINELKPLLTRSAAEKIFSHHRETPLRDVAVEPSGGKGLEVYVIRKNDTLYSLAKRFHTTVDRLMAMNRINHATIYQGQTIKVPKP